MRRALTWFAGLAGIAALLRRRARQRVTLQPAVSSPSPTAPDPAIELRQKLDETRAAEPAAETEPASTLEERRARVHERAQDAIDLMRSADDEPPA